MARQGSLAAAHGIARLEFAAQPASSRRSPRADRRSRLATAALLAALADAANDRALDHSLTYALIEIGENDALRQATRSDNVHVRRAALVALDQMGAGLDAKLVIASLDDADDAVREFGSLDCQPASGMGCGIDRLFAPKLALTNLRRRTDAAHRSAGQAGKKHGDSAASGRRGSACEPDPRPARKLALAAMAASGQKELPQEWLRALTELLSADSAAAGEALATIRAIPPAKAQAEQIAGVLQKVGDSSAPPDLRLAALAIVPGGVKSLSAGQFSTAAQRRSTANSRRTFAAWRRMCFRRRN